MGFWKPQLALSISLYAIGLKQSLVCVCDKPSSSFNKALGEETNPRRGCLLTFDWNTFVGVPLRAPKLTLWAFLIILPSASPFTTPLKGDSPSLRGDFGTHLKTGVMEFVEVATYLTTYLVDCVLLSCLSSSLPHCCYFTPSCPVATYTSLVTFWVIFTSGGSCRYHHLFGC